MRVKNKIKFQLFLISVVASIIVILVGYLYYIDEKGKTLTEKYNEIKAISQLKSVQLSQWQKERMSEVKFFTSDQPFIEYISRIIKGEDEFKDKYRRSLMKIMSDKRYENIFMVGEKGDLIFSVNDTKVEIDSTLKLYVERIFNTKEILIRDLYYSNLSNKIYLDFIAPVFNYQGEVASALVFRVNPDDYLYPLIQEWPTPSKTAESIIVRREGDSIRFISKLLHEDNFRLYKTFSIKRTDIPAVRLVLGKQGMFEDKDYSGNKVIGEMNVVQGTSWYMVTKQSTGEVYYDLNKQAVLIIFIVMLTLFFIGAMLAWVYNSRQRNMYKELLDKSSALNQSQGEFSAILYSIADGVITTDLEGRIRHLNIVAEKMTGYKEKDVIGKYFNDVVNIIDDKTGNKVIFNSGDFLKNGEVVNNSGETIISEGGTKTPIDQRSALIIDSFDNKLGFVIVLRDQAEERMKRILLDIRMDIYKFIETHSIGETVNYILGIIGELTESPIIGFKLLPENHEDSSLASNWPLSIEKYHFNADNTDELKKFKESDSWNNSINLKKPFFINTPESKSNLTEEKKTEEHFSRELIIPVVRNNNIIALLGLSGKPTDYSVNDIDITSYMADISWVIIEQKVNEEKLRESEKKYKELIDGMNETIWVIDFKGHLLDVNKTAENVLGYSKEELLEIGLTGIDSSLKKEQISVMAASMQKDFVQIFETTHRCKDGKIIPVEVYSSLINYHGRKAILSIARDISDRKKSAEQIRQEKMLLRTLIDNLPDAIYVKDKEGRKLIANSADLRMMHKKSEEEVIGKTDKEIYQNDYEKAGFDEDMIVINSGQKIINKENEYFDDHGNLRWRLISKIPLYNEEGMVIGLIGFSHDFTERKLMEIQRSQMIRDLILAKDKAEESDRLKTAFLANISHEIRTPMNGILGFLELLTEPDLDEGQKEIYLDIMNKSGQRLLDTINDIVELAKIESGQLDVVNSKVDLYELMNYHFSFFTLKAESQKLGLGLDYQVPVNMSIVELDKNKIDSILSNLLNNALKYTKEGSIIFGVKISGDELLFSVRDTGPGIPEDKIDDIFKRFVQADQYSTRSKEGSGLGLSISKAYVEVQGGKIWVESKEGVGSTFYFTLPYSSVQS